MNKSISLMLLSALCLSSGIALGGTKESLEKAAKKTGAKVSKLLKAMRKMVTRRPNSFVTPSSETQHTKENSPRVSITKDDGYKKDDWYKELAQSQAQNIKPGSLSAAWDDELKLDSASEYNRMKHASKGHQDQEVSQHFAGMTYQEETRY